MSLNHQDSEDKIYFEHAEFASHGRDEAIAGVFHGFFSRRGGVSEDIYASLNCGQGSDDRADAVARNRQIVADIGGFCVSNLISVHQVHSSRCVIFDERPNEGQIKLEADALATDKPGLTLSVLTADCAPVLFYGRKSDGARVIGAAHAGWKGAVGGVLENTVAKMKSLGAVDDSIEACIGPCIGKDSYEVREDFCTSFLEEDSEAEIFFKDSKNVGHLMFDLVGYCAFRLRRAGVKSVYIKDLDTYFNEEDFFSYRRTTHRRDRDYGRQISVISIVE